MNPLEPKQIAKPLYLFPWSSVVKYGKPYQSEKHYFGQTKEPRLNVS